MGRGRLTSITREGKLDELIDVVIEGGAKVFVSAVGVAPREVVRRLQGAGVVYVNMVGFPWEKWFSRFIKSLFFYVLQRISYYFPSPLKQKDLPSHHSL